MSDNPIDPGPLDRPDTRLPDTHDPFDDILSPEEDFYAQGFAQGLADGRTAGRAEGLDLGLRTGITKARELGRLRGRLAVWQQRRKHQAPAGDLGQQLHSPKQQQQQQQQQQSSLDRQLQELETLLQKVHTQNTAEEVQRLEEQVRKAGKKAEVVARLLGEKGVGRPREVVPVDFTGAFG